MIERVATALFLFAWRSLSELLLGNPFRHNEVIVVSVIPPGTGRNIIYFYKLPVGHVSRLQTEIISNCRRDVEAGTAVQVRLRFLVLKNILIMIGPERPAILPLGVTGPISLANRDPPIPTNRLAGLAAPPNPFLFEPWYYQRRFGLGLAMSDVVIR